MLSFRLAALLVLAYVALDLGNPMMPGAFQLVDGSLETVDGYQLRGEEMPAPAALTASRHVLTARSELAVRPSRRVVPVSRPVPRAPRKPAAPLGDPASSPDDD